MVVVAVKMLVDVAREVPSSDGLVNMQHAAARCSTLQHTATREVPSSDGLFNMQHAAAQCNRMQ